MFGDDSGNENPDGGTLDQGADESGSDDDAGRIGRLETAAGVASKSGTNKRKACQEVPMTPLRLWLPACMIRAVAPALAEGYDEKMKAGEEKKAKRGIKGRHAGTGVKSTSRRTNAKGDADDDDDESVPGPSTSKTAAASKAKSKAVRVGGGGKGRKPKQAARAQLEDDAYEFIDLSAGEEKGSHYQHDERAPQCDETVHFSAPATKPSTLSPVASMRVFEEEEDSEHRRPASIIEIITPPSIPTSKFKSKSKSTAVPRHEEEESSSSSSHNRPSIRTHTENVRRHERHRQCSGLPRVPHGYLNPGWPSQLRSSRITLPVTRLGTSIGGVASNRTFVDSSYHPGFRAAARLLFPPSRSLVITDLDGLGSAKTSTTF